MAPMTHAKNGVEFLMVRQRAEDLARSIENWLIVTSEEKDFSQSSVAWLKDSHGKLAKLLSEPHQPVCTAL